MTDWQDSTNLLKEKNKREKMKKIRTIQVGLRCWECGLYLDRVGSGHYCNKCLAKHLKKLSVLPSKLDTEDDELLTDPCDDENDEDDMT